MTDQDAARWNAKHSAFYVTRFSPRSGHQIQVGKPHTDIREALAAAKRADLRDRTWMHFIDYVQPKRQSY